MVKEIEFTIYDRGRDVESVVNLLKRNKYYLGKLDPDLTAERYIEYQDRRGFQFAVVAKVDDEVIGHIALYLNGNQGVAQKKQIILGTALVDARYQRLMPSIGALYMLAMETAIKNGYKVVICDTLKANMNSLYVLRRLGGVLLKNEPSIYGLYLLRIYTPLIIETLGSASIAEATKEFGQIYEVTKRLDKRTAKQKTELIDNKYVLQAYHVKEANYKFFVNIINENVGKILLDDYFQAVLLENDSKLAITAYQNLNVQLAFYEGGDKIKEEAVFLAEGEIKAIAIKKSIEKIRLGFSDSDTTFYMYPRPNIQKEQKYLQGSSAEQILDLQTGYLRFFKEGNPLFVEMWPCITRPLLFGYLVPKEIALIQEKLEENRYRITEESKKYTLYREYTFEENRVRIDTYADIFEEIIREPVFHLAFDDLSYNCTIVTESEIVNKSYNDKDYRAYCDEIIYEYFGNEDYTKSFVKKVEVVFGHEKYEIVSDQDIYCFHQYNYLGFRFRKQSDVLEKNIVSGSTRIQLGTITIERSSI